ncbi:MAG: response regulator transcription factor [Marinilabiliales bacterium]
MDNKKVQILYVEDDETLSFITKDNLERRGYSVTCCNNGSDAIELFKKTKFDLCLLDIMLPKLDGFTLTQQIRKLNKHVPIIYLTAKSMLEDKIKGLSFGGDDYITKPFSIEELVLKIEIFLKRNIVYSKKETDNNIYIIGDTKFDVGKRMLIFKDHTKNLTLKEAELLKFLYLNKKRNLKRSEILTAVWGEDDYFSGRSLDVYISKLRKYFKHDKSVKIENLHGIGFLFDITD